MNVQRMAALLTVAFVATSCGGAGAADVRIVILDHPRTSPSGRYTAYAEPGPEEDAVATRIILVRNENGVDVFHDCYAYSTRHGVMITWLPTKPEQLWIYSGDVGVFKVDPDGNGAFIKTSVRRVDVPAEISELWRPSRS